MPSGTAGPQFPSGSATTAGTLSFIIPVRNDATGVERCLAAIATATQGRSCEVIVLDNGSRDGSAARAESCGATVFRLDGRVARLRNFGAQSATGRLLAFVDADHEVDPDWARAALELLEDESIAAAGAPYHPPESANWVQRSYNLLRDHNPGIRDTSWLGSGNLIVRRECFNSVGGFDETLETCEDVDLCQRLRSAGFRVVTNSRLRSTHYGDPSTLRRLFLSELWRGRDNLRVSLRQLTWRDLPSVLIPIVDLVATLAAVAAVFWWGRSGLALAAGLLAIVVGLSWLRAGRMVTRSAAPAFAGVAQACVVAFLYDMARAFALVVRLPHRRVSGPLTTE